MTARVYEQLDVQTTKQQPYKPSIMHLQYKQNMTQQQIMCTPIFRGMTALKGFKDFRLLSINF